MTIKWKYIRDVFFLTTANEDVLVEAPHQGGHIPAAVLDYSKYKTGVDISDQMLAYYSFERKAIKWWGKKFLSSVQLGSGQCTHLA